MRMAPAFNVVTERVMRQTQSPPSRRRGGCAIKKMARFLTRRRRGSCFKLPIDQIRSVWISGSLRQLPRPLLFKGCFAAFFFTSRPPLLREGGDWVSLHYLVGRDL